MQIKTSTLAIMVALAPCLVGQSTISLQSSPSAMVEPASGGLLPLPLLYTVRGTQTSSPKLILMDPKGQETTLFEDVRKEVDGDFFTNPIQALAMDPGGQFVLFATLDKASNFKLNNAGGFGIGGVSFTISSSNAFRKRDFRALHLWRKDTGRCEPLWDEKGLEAASDAWRKTDAGKAFSPQVKFHKAVASGGPLTIHHLIEDRFILVTSTAVFEIQVSKPTIRPILAKEDMSVTVSWRDHQGKVRCLGTKEQRELYPETAIKDGKSVPTTTHPSLETIVASELFEIGVDGKAVSSGVIQGDSGNTLNSGALVVSSTDRFRRTYTLEGKAVEGPAAHTGDDRKWQLVHASTDASGYYLLDNRSFADDTLARHDQGHKLKWQFKVGNTPGDLYFVEAGDTLGLLCTRNRKLHRIILNRDTGAVISDQEWDQRSGGEAGRALTYGLVRRMSAIPTAHGQLVWIAANGGKVVESFEKSKWTPTAPSPKPAMPGPESGAWYRLGTDLILRPLIQRPLADQVVLVLGGYTFPFGLPLNAGLRVDEHALSNLIAREGDQDSYYKDGRDSSLAVQSPDLSVHTAPALRAWAQAILAPRLAVPAQ